MDLVFYGCETMVRRIHRCSDGIDRTLHYVNRSSSNAGKDQKVPWWRWRCEHGRICDSACRNHRCFDYYPWTLHQLHGKHFQFHNAEAWRSTPGSIFIVSNSNRNICPCSAVCNAVNRLLVHLCNGTKYLIKVLTQWCLNQHIHIIHFWFYFMYPVDRGLDYGMVHF